MKRPTISSEPDSSIPLRLSSSCSRSRSSTFSYPVIHWLIFAIFLVLCNYGQPLAMVVGGSEAPTTPITVPTFNNVNNEDEVGAGTVATQADLIEYDDQRFTQPEPNALLSSSPSTSSSSTPLSSSPSTSGSSTTTSTESSSSPSSQPSTNATTEQSSPPSSTTTQAQALSSTDGSSSPSYSSSSVPQTEPSSDQELAMESRELPPEVKDSSPPAESRDATAEEGERRKSNSNPSVDEIISGIIQLMAGNVKLQRPTQTQQQPGPKPGLPPQPMGDFNSGDPNSRPNHRSPPKVHFMGPAGHHIPNLPPNLGGSILSRPAGFPIPLPPMHMGNLPIPLHQPPSKPNFHIPDSDVSALLGLVKPNPVDFNEATKVKLRPPMMPNDPRLPPHGPPPHHLPPQPQPPQSNPSVPQDSDNVADSDQSQHHSNAVLLNPIRPSIDFNVNNLPSAIETVNPTGATPALETHAPSINEVANRPSMNATHPLGPPQSPSTYNSPQDNEFGGSIPSGPITDWVPLYLNPAQGEGESKKGYDFGGDDAEEPMIITLPESYGPSTFDVVVKHHIGSRINGEKPETMNVNLRPFPTTGYKDHEHHATHATMAGANSHGSSALSSSSSSSSSINLHTKLPHHNNNQNQQQQHPQHDTKSLAGSSTLSSTSSMSVSLSTTVTPTPSLPVQPARIRPTAAMKTPPSGNSDVKVTPTSASSSASTAGVSRTRTNDGDVVYGRPAKEQPKPIIPSFNQPDQQPGSGPSRHGIHRDRATATSASSTRTSLSQSTPSSTSIGGSRRSEPARITPSPTSTTTASFAKPTVSPVGKPFVVPVEVDEVKPQVISNPSHQGSVFVDGKSGSRVPPKPNGLPTLQVGAGVTINSDDNGNPKNTLNPNPVGGSRGSPVVRRPPFRPKTNTPLVRIDTCIVGDDSTCDTSNHERCLTEGGISSCHCKPAFSRISTRGPCVPVVNLAISIKVDKMSDKRVIFNRNLLNPNSEDYQYLEYESLQALNSLFSMSKLSNVFMGAKVNKFYSVGGKTLINASVALESNEATSTSSIKKLVQQEVSRVIATNNNLLGESVLSVDGSLNAVPRVEDLNECSSTEWNDCSKHAKCVNEFGSFRCICLEGYEDKHPGDQFKSGRVCSACSPQYCNNRGDCFIVNGQRECRCKSSFIGARCDIDGEVLGVAVGGSLAALVIIIITFLCLYMWNQRWKRDQQKMEAMSGASGQTFSYLNKQNATYRLTMDDRMRWAHIAEATNNFYVSPDHIVAAASQPHTMSHSHVYATPNRLSASGGTTDGLLDIDHDTRNYNHNTRKSRPKSRSAMYTGPFNETEFSVRETLYSPGHMLAAQRAQIYS